MLVTIAKIERFIFRNVHFYTVLIDGNDVTEFEDFINRMQEKCPIKLGELLSFIDEIGQKYGVQNNHFRHERNSHALPPTYLILSEDDSEETSQFGLRLYCCKLSSNVVILYNGDLKTKHYPDECPNVAKHFKFSLQITKRIDKAISEGDMSIDKTEILLAEDFVLEI